MSKQHFADMITDLLRLNPGSDAVLFSNGPQDQSVMVFYKKDKIVKKLTGQDFLDCLQKAEISGSVR